MPTLRTSLLRHELEPGHGPESHYDWLLESRPSAPPNRDVVSWRVGIRIDQMPPGTKAPLQRTKDHQATWLELKEPTELSDHRGMVTPCSQGRIVAIDFTNKALWSVSIRWKNASTDHYQIHSPDLPEATVIRLDRPEEPT